MAWWNIPVCDRYDRRSPASPDPSLAMMRCLSAVVLSSALVCPLAAQVEVPTLRHPANQEGLELQMRDLNPVLERMAVARSRDYATDEPIQLSPFRTTAKALAEATALFIDPPLPDGDHVALVGGRYLVSLGNAEQQAWTDQGQAKWCREPRPIRRVLLKPGTGCA